MRNKVTISFEVEGENDLSVHIETDRLYLESVQESDIEDYTRLFTNPENRKKFGNGKPLSAEDTKKAVLNWENRWGKNDPFSAVSARTKEGVFVGHLVLGHGDNRGESEFACIIDQPLWNQGYGKESGSAVVTEYGPELKRKGYRVPYKVDEKVDLEEFNAITATARTDNDYSIKILESVGLKKIGKTEKWGHERHQFFSTVKEIEAHAKAKLSPEPISGLDMKNN